MSTNQFSPAYARARVGIVPLILVALQTILLYLTTSSSSVLNALYGCSSLCATGGQRFVPLIAALIGVVMFALPAIIGVVSHSWQRAVVLAALPWFIAVIAHAGTLLAPYIGLGSHATGGRFDLPFWLNATHVLPLLASLALFTALGTLGWLARRAFAAA